MTITFDPEAPNSTGGISFDFSGPVSNISDENAQARAKKYDYALGQDSPGPDVIYSKIRNNEEQILRDYVASDKNMKDEELRNQMITEATKSFGGKLTPEQFGYLSTLSSDSLRSPDTILEGEYANRIFSDTYDTNDERNAVDDARSKSLPVVNFAEDYANDMLRKHEVLKKITEDLDIKWDEKSRLGKLGDYLENVVPFVSWANMSDEIKGKPGGSFLLGNNMLEQVQYALTLPPEQFSKQVTETVNEIAESNILDAQAFIKALYSYSNSDAAWGNLQSLFDLSSIGDVAGVAVAGAKGIAKTGARAAAKSVEREASEKGFKDAVGAFRNTVTQMTKSQTPEAPEIFSSAGKSKSAVLAQTFKTLKDRVYAAQEAVTNTMTNVNKNQMKNLLKEIPSFADPFKLARGDFALDADGMYRVINRMTGAVDASFKSLVDTPRIDRLNDNQILAAIQDTQESITREYPSLNNGIMDIEFAKPDLANANHVNITIKNSDGTPFTSAEKAKYFADNELSLKEPYEIGQQGSGFTIKLDRTVDETTEAVRNATIETNNTTPSNLAATNFISGYVRSARDLLSPSQGAKRKVIVHGIEKADEFGFQMAEPMRNLPSKSKARLERFLSFQRDYVDSKGNVGIAFDTQGDFEKAWQGAFGHLPTDKESAAYHAYQRFYDLDYFQRNLLIYKMKARQGVNKFTLSAMEKNAVAPEFEGVNVSGKISLSDLEDKTGVLFWDSNSGKQFFNKNDLTEDALKLAQEAVDNEGYQIIQLSDPYSRPLKDASGNGSIIEFVITKDYKRDNLPFKQIDYNPGGHKIYEYDHWIKQPKILQIGNRRIYSGDTTIRPVARGKLASEYASRYEEARKLLKAGDEKALAAYVEKNLPETLSQFKGYFDNGFLDKDMPIRTVRSNQKTIDDKVFRDSLGGFEDSRNNKYNIAGRVGTEFLGDRNLDLKAIHTTELGSENNPLLALKSPKLLDPLSTLSRSFGSLSRNSLLDDYRTLSAEHFVREFGDVINLSKAAMDANPAAALFAELRKTADPEKYAAARNYQRKVGELLSVRTEVERNLSFVKEKLYNSVYDNFGENFADRIDDKFLSKIHDPTRFFRSTAFALKLGLFNPLQLFKQAQTLGMVLAIGDTKAALKSFPVYFLTQAIRMSNGNEAILRGAAKKAAAFGWKEDHFLEWYKAYMDSGLNIIKGDHALKDALEAPALFKSSVGKYLPKHTVFFDEGERTHRIVGSATAYLEWRQKNPTATMSRKDWERIMLRQDDLTQNMTRASNASWQKGLVSIPMQFYSYQARLWEQMLGRNLTKAQKAKILMVQSALYGVPIAITGNAIGVWPWYEDVRKYQLENGQNPEGFAWNSFHNGLVASTMKLITGEDYDVGEAYGPLGLSFFKDAQDKGMFDVLLGAAGGTFGEVIKTSLPVVEDLWNMPSDGIGEGSRAILASDLLDFARNASSVNQLTNLYYASNLGKYITKSGLKIDGEVTSWDTIMMAFGINKQDVNDVFLMTESMKDQKQAQAEAQKQMSKYLNKYWESIRNGESEEVSNAFFKRARLWFKAGDFGPEEFPSLVSRAAQNEDLIDAVNMKFLTNGPASQRADRMKQLMENK